MELKTFVVEMKSKCCWKIDSGEDIETKENYGFSLFLLYRGHKMFQLNHGFRSVLDKKNELIKSDVFDFSTF